MTDLVWFELQVRVYFANIDACAQKHIMSSAPKTAAIVVWDIENNRVPLQLVPRCFEIVQWLLQDIQDRSPNSTVLRVYVAGTFDKYPTELKNALCTHPRVQLLYSIGKVTPADSICLSWECAKVSLKHLTRT